MCLLTTKNLPYFLLFTKTDKYQLSMEQNVVFFMECG